MSFALPTVRAASGDASEVQRAGLGLAAVAIFLFTLALFAPQALGDGDTWSHVATGEWIIAHGAAPRADPFSFSMPGAPWTAHEWLSEVMLALAFRLGGWSGVVLLTGAAAAAAALIVGLSAARELRGAALVATVAIGLSLVTANLLARPHVLALPLLAAWSAALFAARDRGRPPPLSLAALMTAVGEHARRLHVRPRADRAVRARGGDGGASRSASLDPRAWTTFALAALAAALINPYGVDALLLPFRLMAVENLSRISEWRPQDFSHVGTMELALLTLLGLTLTRPFAMPPIRAALLIALVAMALQHSRHQVLLGILAPMLLARPIAAAFGRDALRRRTAARRADRGGRDRWSRRWRSAACGSRANRADRRRRLADFGLERGSGGTQAKAGAQRLCVRRLSHLRACAAVHRRPGGALRRQDAEPLRQAPARRRRRPRDTLKRYDIAWTIFPPTARIVAILDREPGWRRLYADATAVVHVRDAALKARG